MTVASLEHWGIVLPDIEYSEDDPALSSNVDFEQSARRTPVGLVAARLIAALRNAQTSIVYIALSEAAGLDLAKAIRCLDPDQELIRLPPWDCLPYDRVPASRQCQGQRMDALRDWSQPSSRSRLMVTSIEAILQRIPPSKVIESSWFELAVGQIFDRAAFERFIRRTGYVKDSIVDEPGEFAFRDDVIDIFPAGALAPIRIVLAEDGKVSELRSYDPASQRTEHIVDEIVFGPASEAVVSDNDFCENGSPPPEATETALFHLYGDMPTVFSVLAEASITFAAGTAKRLESHFDIIDEARQAHRDFDSKGRDSHHSLYLDHMEWSGIVKTLRLFSLDLDDAGHLPAFGQSDNPREAFADCLKTELRSKRTVIIAGEGGLFDGFCRRAERDSKLTLVVANTWSDAQQGNPGTILKLRCALDHGFIDSISNLMVITVGDVLNNSVETPGATTLVSEAELQVGDVVVHEDHGVGVMKGMENVAVDGVIHDTARLEYRDGASILVPMEEFGKLWRYGSEPEAVTLDRLHSEAWATKRIAITKDIRVAAKHLLRLAKERQDAAAEAIIPPRREYARFVARFPHAETADQASAVKAVLADIASGKVMNRLICGDVGFGKTEVALRAAAAVALSGRQVVIVSPTTVLARQHFAIFERRFATTDVKVAMLSRVVAAGEVRCIKAGLASGEIDIVIATQAILAKDLAFSRLALLIIDEEHRFGTRDKQAMRALAPRLHMLTMSATPIPRTLQAAMVGVQDVSMLTTAPSKRRPVRTSLSSFDRASMRVALLREYRRGGQSFVVAPQIEDLEPFKNVLSEIVPELSVRIAHGKMPAPEMDEIMVRFADGEGDVLLSTNIVESGLDVPRANTIFVWRADLFGSAQLHQLRGRVGRGKAQGIAYLLTAEGEDPSEATRLRLMGIVENNRLGDGLTISIQDLDLRGGGDIAGEDQAGHMKIIGVSLYQKLLERAIAATKKEEVETGTGTALNLGIAGIIPTDYVSDATVRLNLYARLLRAVSRVEIDRFAEELEDRFGELPDEVSILLRLEKLKLAAAGFGICKLESGPRAMAVTFSSKPNHKTLGVLSSHSAVLRGDRIIYEQQTEVGIARIDFFERLLGA